MGNVDKHSNSDQQQGIFIYVLYFAVCNGDWEIQADCERPRSDKVHDILADGMFHQSLSQSWVHPIRTICRFWAGLRYKPYSKVYKVCSSVNHKLRSMNTVFNKLSLGANRENYKQTKILRRKGAGGGIIWHFTKPERARQGQSRSWLLSQNRRYTSLSLDQQLNYLIIIV